MDSDKPATPEGILTLAEMTAALPCAFRTLERRIADNQIKPDFIDDHGRMYFKATSYTKIKEVVKRFPALPTDKEAKKTAEDKPSSTNQETKPDEHNNATTEPDNPETGRTEPAANDEAARASKDATITQGENLRDRGNNGRNPKARKK